MSSPTVRRPHLHALTGLRFFAAMYVVLYHYAKFWLADGPRWVDALNRGGPVAVSLFFVLSGLVLTYGSTDATGRCARSARDFWFARFSRIYPLFLLAIVLSLPSAVASMRHGHSTAAAVALAAAQTVVALSLLQAWVPHLAFVGNPPGWSLSVEAFFYFTFPFLVHRLRCRTLRQMLGLTIPLWILAMAPTVLLEIVERNGGLDGAGRSSILGLGVTPALFAERFVAHVPFMRLAEFCIGICIGHFVVARIDGRAGLPVESLDASTRLRHRLGLAGLASVVALVVALALAGDLGEHNEIVVNSAFAAPLFAVLLISLTLGSGPHVRLLGSKTFVRLGAASYALYIIQDPFAWWWGKLVRLDLAQPVSLLAFLVAIVGASIVCERFVEIPAREALLRRWRTRDWSLRSRREVQIAS